MRKSLCTQCFPKAGKNRFFDSAGAEVKKYVVCTGRHTSCLQRSHTSSRATVGDRLAARSSTNIVTANKSAPNFNVIK